MALREQNDKYRGTIHSMKWKIWKLENYKKSLLAGLPAAVRNAPWPIKAQVATRKRKKTLRGVQSCANAPDRDQEYEVLHKSGECIKLYQSKVIVSGTNQTVSKHCQNTH